MTPVRIVVWTGAPFHLDHWVMVALDPASPWCPDEGACDRHRRRGRHLARSPSGGYELSVDIGGCSVEVVRFLKDSDVIEDIRAHPVDAAKLQRADAVLFIVEARAEHLALQRPALDELRRDLRAVGRQPAHVPLVFVLDRDDLDPHDEDPERRGADDETVRTRFTWEGPVAYVRAMSHRRCGVREALGRAVAFAESYRSLDPPIGS